MNVLDRDEIISLRRWRSDEFVMDGLNGERRLAASVFFSRSLSNEHYFLHTVHKGESMSSFCLVEGIDRRSFRQSTRLTRSWRKFHRSRSVVFHRTDERTTEQPNESKQRSTERMTLVMHEDEG